MTSEYWDGFDENIYYHPEKCGLRIVDSWEFGFSYDYDTTLILQDIETGSYFKAHDSGCSCPHPFEDFHSLSDLTPIQKADIERIRIEMESK